MSRQHGPLHTVSDMGVDVYDHRQRCNSEKHPTLSQLFSARSHDPSSCSSRTLSANVTWVCSDRAGQPASASQGQVDGLCRGADHGLDRSVPAEPDGPRPSPRLFSARVHSATRDGPATYLMAKACRRRCISTILSSRSHRYHERRPLSDRSAPTTPWPSRPRGRAHGRRKHEIGLGVRSTIPRDIPE